MDTAEVAEPRQHSQNHPQSLQRQQKPVKTGTWLSIEDARLREAVAQHGTRWVRVAGDVGTRNGDQCAKRWNENLKPDLDHSPWTPEEDERLLDIVKTYGRNWKFMADNIFESRAPLALKNRYSLLMRRLERQGNGKEQSANVGGAKTLLRYTVPSQQSSGSATPSSSGSAVELTNIFSGGSGAPSHHADYTSNVSAASSYFALSTGPLGAGTSSGQVGGGGGTALWTPTTAISASTAWDDQDLIWQQQPFLGSGMDSDNVSSGTAKYRGENEVEKLTIMSDNGTNSRRLPLSGSGLNTPLPSDECNSGVVPPADVEYSVTCQWGKLKTLMNHLVDAAMSENAGWMAEDEQVTMTMRLKV